MIAGLSVRAIALIITLFLSLIMLLLLLLSQWCVPTSKQQNIVSFAKAARSESVNLWLSEVFGYPVSLLTVIEILLTLKILYFSPVCSTSLPLF